MAAGQLYINDVDAATYGVTLDSSALSTLMTPPPFKDWISNDVRTDDGVTYLTTSAGIPKIDKREFTIAFNLVATDEDDFMTKYAALCAIFAKGILNLRTKYQPKVVYRCIYVSCSQFSQLRRQIASFTLSLIEPDPTNRAYNG